MQMQMKKKLAKKVPIALSFLKNAIKRRKNMSLNAALEYEMRLFSMLFSTKDQEEGMKAFIERREPVFRGE